MNQPTNQWQVVLKTQRYTYWHRLDHTSGVVIYNVTENDTPPSPETGGYYNLDSLRRLKNDEPRRDYLAQQGV